jgi:protein-tyrosine phosphatase
MRPLLEVRPEYLEASMDAMERAYGGVERFVTGQLGVDIGSLRAHYLEA